MSAYGWKKPPLELITEATALAMEHTANLATRLKNGDVDGTKKLTKTLAGTIIQLVMSESGRAPVWQDIPGQRAWFEEMRTYLHEEINRAFGLASFTVIKQPPSNTSHLN